MDAGADVNTARCLIVDDDKLGRVQGKMFEIALLM